MMKKIILLSLFIVAITVTTVFGILFFKSIDPYNTIQAFSRNDINLIIDDNPIELTSYPIVTEDKVLMPIEVIRNHIYEDIELRKKYNRLYVNIENPKFQLEKEELTERLNDKIRLNFLTEEIDDVNYINIKGLEKIFDINYQYIKDTNVLIINKVKENIKLGEVNKEIRLRPEKNSFSFSMDKLQKGEELVVFEEGNKWLKVRTNKGYIGYVLKNNIDILEVSIDVDRQLNELREKWSQEKKVNLVWNYIGKYSPDLSKEEKIEGLDVIAPTWFSVVNKDGFVVNNGDVQYVKDAHEKGYRVWGLITNSFDKDLTKGLLSSEEAQQRVINQLLIYSSIYNLDGINIDFENVYYSDKDNLTEFVDKLTKELKKQNLMISIDMTVPSSSLNWSKFYDREKLGNIVDYCIVMTYDEHWAASPKSGSVASIDWVERGIQRTLKYIPKEKVLMGIPFYTREWEETKTDNGKIKVKSKALTMRQVTNKIEEYAEEVVWLEEEGQNYFEYNKDGKRYRIWIEDEKSIELKAKLVHDYDLVGVGSWRKGFEEEDIWEVLNKVLKDDKKMVKK